MARAIRVLTTDAVAIGESVLYMVGSIALVPFCGIGKIPVNGDLFEHMTDPPVAGDWKDDSALRR